MVYKPVPTLVEGPVYTLHAGGGEPPPSPSPLHLPSPAGGEGEYIEIKKFPHP